VVEELGELGDRDPVRPERVDRALLDLVQRGRLEGRQRFEIAE